jgi:hypothetical protein
VSEDAPESGKDIASARPGEEFGPSFPWVVEAGKAQEFGRACLDGGSKDPAYVPITFPEVANHFWEPSESQPRRSESDLRRLLHGEQEFVYARPLRIGDILTGQTRLKDRYVKKGRRGGEMTFMVYETRFVDQTGDLVVQSTKTLLEVSETRHE